MTCTTGTASRIRRSLVRLGGLGICLAALNGTAVKSAMAQQLDTAGSVAFGSGLSWGNQDGNGTVTKRTPLFLEAGLRTYNDERPRLWWSAALRAELDGRTSVGVVPRLELVRPLGPVRIHAGAGVPLTVAPFSLFGAEALVKASLDLGEGSVFASLMLDAYVLGTDLPENSSLIMLNITLGGSLAL